MDKFKIRVLSKTDDDIVLEKSMSFDEVEFLIKLFKSLLKGEYRIIIDINH